MLKFRVFLGLFMLAAGPAWAGLEICNKTGARHSVAVGYKDGDVWTSEGWWNLDPGKCATPLKADLRYRYYYFRAINTGRTFQDENYVFCTDSGAFTIEGDKDCADRGYRRSTFRRIDTGEDTKVFSFAFDDTMSVEKAAQAEPEAPAKAEPEIQAEAPPAPAPDPKPDSSAPGTWGEPYFSATAVFQDCLIETEVPFCTFHADGTKFFVYEDGRSSSYVFRFFESLWPGTPIEVEGDLEAIYDRTADVVLRSALPRTWTRWDTILDKLQGAWYSVSDPNSQFTIIGSELHNTYDGAYGGLEYLSLSSYCDGYEGGEYFVRMDEESGDQLCYSIEELEPFYMLLMYLPRANFHEYRKLD